MPLFLTVIVFLVIPQAVLAGTVIGDLAASMRAGTWAELSTKNIGPTLANLRGSEGTIVIYTDDMVWNPTTQEVFMVGADHLAPEGPQFVSYSARNNTWQRLIRPAWLNITFFHGYDHSAIDQANGRFYHRPYMLNMIHRYDTNSKAWTELPNVNTYQNCCDALEYFPELDGLIWVHGELGEIWLFKESTGQWSRLGTWAAQGGGTWNFAEYNPVHKVLVFGSGGPRTLFKLSSTGQITQLNKPPVSFYDGSGYNGVFTVDPVSGEYLLLTPTLRQLYSYDVSGDLWHVQPSASKPDFNRRGVAAAPISTHGVILFVTCGRSNCKAYLYKHAARSGLPVTRSAPVQ
jgi:hypothetical protein